MPSTADFPDPGIESGSPALQVDSEPLGFPGGSAGKESACTVGDLGSIPSLGIFLWRRARQPTPVLLPGEFP